MKVLILGGAGMLGHKLWQVFHRKFDTWLAIRSTLSTYERFGIFDPARTLEKVDVFNFDTVICTFSKMPMDVVINAVGITKQNPVINDPLMTITVNSLFPHRLATLCKAYNRRLIHISTDCVFSGRKGGYTEQDVPDPVDFYGRSKLLGEVVGKGILTLRTSIIGRELGTANGLVEWFLSKRGDRVWGYTNAIYTGFPTLILAQIIADVIERHPDLYGLYHVSSDPISKYDLLCLLRDAYNIGIKNEPSPEFICNRSLDSSDFRRITGFVPRSWPDMIREMADDPTPYDKWR